MNFMCSILKVWRRNYGRLFIQAKLNLCPCRPSKDNILSARGPLVQPMSRHHVLFNFAQTPISGQTYDLQISFRAMSTSPFVQTCAYIYRHRQTWATEYIIVHARFEALWCFPSRPVSLIFGTMAQPGFLCA